MNVWHIGHLLEMKRISHDNRWCSYGMATLYTRTSTDNWQQQKRGSFVHFMAYKMFGSL